MGIFNFARLLAQEQEQARRSYGGRKRKKKQRRPGRVEGWRGAVTVPLIPGLGRILATYEAEGRAVHVGPPDLATGKTALWIGRAPKAKRPLCGAKTRKGTPCQARAVSGHTRCRMHGGLSTGPKTEEGRERVRENNRRRAQLRREMEQAGTA